MKVISSFYRGGEGDQKRAIKANTSNDFCNM